VENSKNSTSSDLIGQRQQRLDKVAKLAELGIDPYPSNSRRNITNAYINDHFEEKEGDEVIVAGRVMTWRSHGEIQFVDLQDSTGRIQLYIRNDMLVGTSSKNQTLGVENLDLIDAGDFIEAKGIVTKTKVGQISVQPTEIVLLTKSIRPLPNKWQSLTDKEFRFRRRYVDMTMDTEVRKRFERRARFWESVRNFLNSDGFYEVNIPVLEHTTGGADAKPFETYYDALSEYLYLRISHELPLKRLIGAGFEKVYDLGPRFRNEGFSDEHLPEHIAMEWYWAYADYKDGMRFTEAMFKHVLNEVYGKLKFNVKGHDVDLSKDWDVLDFTTVIKERFDVDIFNASLEEMKSKLIEANPEVDDIIMNRSRLADGLWKVIRKDVSGPAFLTGVPKFLSPLAKSNKENPLLTDRFHPIIAGSEMANAFSELNDPVDQLERFTDQQKLREDGDDEAHMLDIDFVEMLEYGMPPTVGFGMSERVFWMFENVSAREGVPFPPLKRGHFNSTKKIYGDVYDFEAEAKSYKRKSGGDGLGATGTVKAMKQDKTQKMVLVISKDLEGWQLTNTIGHLSAYLGSKIGNELVSRATFETKDEQEIVANSQYPIITMVAKPGQMLNFLNKVEESGLQHLAYTQSMIDFNDDEELAEDFISKDKDEVNYIGIGVFGSNDEIDKLTKKFSLWK
jgi:lysyl-tRNA synthetase class 2